MTNPPVSWPVVDAALTVRALRRLRRLWRRLDEAGVESVSAGRSGLVAWVRDADVARAVADDLGLVPTPVTGVWRGRLGRMPLTVCASRPVRSAPCDCVDCLGRPGRCDS